MDLTLERYSESIKRLPVSGKHIIGSQKESFIVAYQAFKPSIAEFAVKNQRFGGNDYSHDRMTWIKPNFLWMMYRSGWATKPGQERILAIWIKKDSFDQILNEATHSTFDPTHFSSREKWKEQLSHSEVRLQWDPDHDPYGNKIERRAIQLGIKGELLRTFTDQWINPDYSSGEKMSIARAFELDGCSFGDETLGLVGHWQVGSGSFRRIWYDFVPLLTTRHTSPMTIACGNGLY